MRGVVRACVVRACVLTAGPRVTGAVLALDPAFRERMVEAAEGARCVCPPSWEGGARRPRNGEVTERGSKRRRRKTGWVARRGGVVRGRSVGVAVWVHS